MKVIITDDHEHYASLVANDAEADGMAARFRDTIAADPELELFDVVVWPAELEQVVMTSLSGD